MFEIWDETGKEYGLTLSELQLRLCTYRGEVMVRYLNRLGLPATLFLTVQQGRAYQRFKAGTPPLDWDWLAQSIHTVHSRDTDIHQLNNTLRPATT
ncbi:hypothetical protein D3C79_810780 [compost metagenome]